MPSGDILYHYTTQTGLLGIIENKVLRTTDILYLNDSTEFRYAFDLARSVLKDRLEGTAAPKEHEQFYRDTLGSLDVVVSILPEAFKVYVGSFSAKRDSLGQWRAYSKDGIGFGIGFEKTYLQTLASQQRCSLVQCEYNNEAISTLVSKFTDSGLQSGVRDSDFIFELLKLTSRVKHPTFEEEEEWRIVIDEESPGKQRFREGKSMLIPFRDFKLYGDDARLHIAEICIGPAPHKELSRISVLELLSQCDVKCAEVTNSQVPYRSW